ncbi:TetR/AcrR family transcriptional regulator [Streptomyces sp. NPDC005438]|uniref:TetR/AcrR family transcriptional regulator n=1 Tax=Streptomyces sp. NPDC005438 TaxID=3156880 RepID=UPI0033B07B58
MSLLWRGSGPEDPPPAGRPGRRPALSVDAVVAAAIELADARGMGAVSMRAVGERLGRSAMALYTYVPGKDELVDLMYDRALGQLPDHYPLSDGWRPALVRWAEDLRAFYLRHPWTLQVSTARPVLGPGEFRLMNTLVTVLRETGLPPGRLRAVVSALMDFVRGSASVVAEARQAAAESGLSDDDWWYGRSPMLAELVPDFDQRFPQIGWIESETGPPQDESVPYLENRANETFAAGLGVLLDGVESAIGTERARR